MLFMLLMICGDVERLPGPEVMEHFSNTGRIKIVYQNTRGFLTNIRSLKAII